MCSEGKWSSTDNKAVTCWLNTEPISAAYSTSLFNRPNALLTEDSTLSLNAPALFIWFSSAQSQFLKAPRDVLQCLKWKQTPDSFWGFYGDPTGNWGHSSTSQIRETSFYSGLMNWAWLYWPLPAESSSLSCLCWLFSVLCSQICSPNFSKLFWVLGGGRALWVSIGSLSSGFWLEASKGTHKEGETDGGERGCFLPSQCCGLKMSTIPLPWLCQLSPQSKGLQQHWASCSYFRPQVILTPLAASPWTIHPPLLVPKTMFLSNSFIKLSGNKVSQPQLPSVSCLDPV